jgi:transcriptional regulator GlxA family with amidase domain
MRPPKARRIVIAVYEGVSLLDLAGPLEAFRVASGFGGSRESRVTYECSCRRVCSVCIGSFLLAAAGVLDGGERLRTGCTRRCWRSAIPA